LSDLIQTVRAIIRDELARCRLPELGIVTEVFARDSGSSPNNHQVNVRLRSSGVELQRAAVAVGRPGISLLPRVDDLVVVAFLNGDLNTPVVLGSVYSDAVHPPEGQPPEAVYVPDDEANSSVRRVYLELPSGTKLLVNDDAVQLEAGGTRVELQRDGDLSVECSGKVTLKADGDLSIEAGGNIEIKAGNNATVKGIAVAVEGTAEAKVKGATVTLAGMTNFSAS
jgi:uncharacterized protein involved in type VI secretion and phage assembly